MAPTSSKPVEEIKSLEILRLKQAHIRGTVSTTNYFGVKRYVTQENIRTGFNLIHTQFDKSGDYDQNVARESIACSLIKHNCRGGLWSSDPEFGVEVRKRIAVKIDKALSIIALSDQITPNICHSAFVSCLTYLKTALSELEGEAHDDLHWHLAIVFSQSHNDTCKFMHIIAAGIKFWKTFYEKNEIVLKQMPSIRSHGLMLELISYREQCGILLQQKHDASNQVCGGRGDAGSLNESDSLCSSCSD